MARVAAAIFGAPADGGDAAMRDTMAEQTDRLKREFWPTVKRVARSIPFAEDAVAAYYCALDRETPTHVRATLIGALLYFVTPFDALPDFLPLAGFVDDAGVLAAAIAAVRLHMNDRHREAARRALKEEGLDV